MLLVTFSLPITHLFQCPAHQKNMEPDKTQTIFRVKGTGSQTRHRLYLQRQQNWEPDKTQIIFSVKGIWKQTRHSPAYFDLKRLSSIRRFLTEDAAKTLVTSYIFSWLDCCNCLLMGTPNSVIQPLQKILNFAARLVLLAPRHHHSTPLLGKLHWLPILERIKYKVACVCFNAMHGSGPAYLSELLHVLHSVSYTAIFFWHTHAENPAIQTQESWLSCFLLLWTPFLEFTPTRT